MSSALSACLAATYTVGAGKAFSTPAQINWAAIRPGDTILIYPGRYAADRGGSSLVVANVSGSAQQRIVITAAPGSARPLLVDGINVTQSHYVSISGLEVTRDPKTQPYAAVVVQNGSSDILLSNLAVHDAHVGVAFTAAGLRNRIEASEIHSNLHHGVTAVKNAVGDGANLSTIAGNTIHNNGGHGVDIESSFWRIEGNSVYANGAAYGGTSGIHLFSAADVASPDCNSNQIFYNHVSGQKDANLADGNGIQIDHFCDGNIVAFNVVWANAGAGISLYVGRNNTIVANTSYMNATDLHRKIYPGVRRGEIILASETTVCTNNSTSGACLGSAAVPAGRGGGNTVYDNIAVSGQADVAAIHASDDYVNPARQTNRMYPNLYFNSAGGVHLRWGSANHVSAGDIDAVTGLTARGGGNLTEMPAFVNTATPGKGANGLRLKKKPSKEGWVIQPTTPDMLGTLPAAGSSYLGAYYAK